MLALSDEVDRVFANDISPRESERRSRSSFGLRFSSRGTASLASQAPPAASMPSRMGVDFLPMVDFEDLDIPSSLEPRRPLGDC